ncbi:MAG: T9SS type A sorting domain-containing protein, partial [Calditrichaeota bacterium]|nr:T9SS type A sorting domain-containing protein [Calditrichota bacterium]
AIEPGNIPGDFQLFQNYPNPFNPSTRIAYSLAKAERVTLAVFNALGREVVKLVDNAPQSAGRHTVDWNGRDATGLPVSSGVYFYRLTSARGMSNARMMLLVK